VTDNGSDRGHPVEQLRGRACANRYRDRFPLGVRSR
jgi:hypothetical protein